MILLTRRDLTLNRLLLVSETVTENIATLAAIRKC